MAVHLGSSRSMSQYGLDDLFVGSADKNSMDTGTCSYLGQQKYYAVLLRLRSLMSSSLSFAFGIVVIIVCASVLNLDGVHVLESRVCGIIY